MGVMSAIIVDDEPLALERLSNILSETCGTEVACHCHNGRETGGKIAEIRPDLVFLDIEMPKLTGFDVVTALSINILP